MLTFPKNIRAPELYGDFWLNSDPIPIRALQGYIILINFLDCSCINCARTLPYVKEWSRKYEDFGLAVIGVHTPKFKFGRDPKNVDRAMKAEVIEFPVVMDNDAIIWTAYQNQHWPAKYLIDKDGYIRYAHHGEGSYQEFERAIQSLLSEAGVRGQLPPITSPIRDVDRSDAVCYHATGELSLGYLRGTIGNVEGFNPESTAAYTDPRIYVPGRFYAHGVWVNDKECMRLHGYQESLSGYITFKYEALEVYVVFGTKGAKSGMVILEQDGQALNAENRGDDVKLLDDGTALVNVDLPRSYQIVKNTEFGEHILKLTTTSPDVCLYSFSFVTGVIPSLVANN